MVYLLIIKIDDVLYQSIFPLIINQDCILFRFIVLNIFFYYLLKIVNS